MSLIQDQEQFYAYVNTRSIVSMCGTFCLFFLSYFIWFAGFRREVLKAMNSNYADELRYSKEMIEEHPKNYQVMNVNMYLIIKQKMPGTFDFLFFCNGRK